MTTNPYIHPVPVGATIPAGTKHATVMPPWVRDIEQNVGSPQRFTTEPIPAPRSADFAWAEYRKDYEPNPAQLTAAHKAFMAGWAAAASEWPRNTDPLNENDHRDRIDSQGNHWRWYSDLSPLGTGGHWAVGVSEQGFRTLESINQAFGPLRFADEVQS